MPSEVMELVGSRKLRNDLRSIIERLESPEEALALEIEVLEQSEENLFGTFSDPTYVDTGALKASLTQSDATGAIRRLNWGGRYSKTIPGIEFGTSIWYAKFQRRIGGPSGKPRGRKRVGPNRVLKFTPAMRREAAKLVLSRIMGRV